MGSRLEDFSCREPGFAAQDVSALLSVRFAFEQEVAGPRKLDAEPPGFDLRPCPSMTLAPGRWRRDVGSGRMAPGLFGDPTVGEE